MALYNYKSAAILSVTAAVNTNQTGSAQVLSEGSSETEQSFKVWFDFSQSGGATSPTTKVRLEHSHDGSNWATLVESTQLTADGSLSEWKDAADVGRYVRAKTLLGGGTLPNHTAKVYLLSHRPFKLKSAA